MDLFAIRRLPRGTVRLYESIKIPPSNALLIFNIISQNISDLSQAQETPFKMSLARVIRIIMASASLFATINAAPAQFGPVTTAIGPGPKCLTVLNGPPLATALVPCTTSHTLPSGPLPTSRALQILPRHKPDHTKFTNVDLDEPFDYPGQFDACTPQQISDIKRSIEDVHRLAGLGASAAEIYRYQHHVANVTLFGGPTGTLDSDVSHMLVERWFGDQTVHKKAVAIRGSFPCA